MNTFKTFIAIDFNLPLIIDSDYGLLNGGHCYRMLANVFHIYGLYSINNIKNGNYKALDLVFNNVHNEI
jgi:hypothetical protein